MASKLYAQVLLAIILGAALGYLAPDIAVKMKPLGDIFIRLIKMLIGPIIFCTVITGIASMDNMKQAGRVALKALIYFTILSFISLLIGLVIANIVQPGAGMNVDAAAIPAKVVDNIVNNKSQPSSLAEFAMHIIPDNPVAAFNGGDILPILFFAILFGCGAAACGEKAKPVVDFIARLSHIFFAIIGFIMKLAPIGAFGAIAFTVGHYGIASMLPLGKLLLCFYATCFLFIFVVIGAVLASIKINIFQYLRYIKDEIFIVFGTSSSESALPRMIDKLTALGCDKSITGLVLPTGYSFNLDGTAIYLTMAATFLAQATNTPMTLLEQFTMLCVMMLTSKGAAGVTGAGFITLAASLGAVGNIPVASIALILGIDRFMSEGRSVTNLIGNGAATIFISRIENLLDMGKAKKLLTQKATPILET